MSAPIQPLSTTWAGFSQVQDVSVDINTEDKSDSVESLANVPAYSVVRGQSQDDHYGGGSVSPLHNEPAGIKASRPAGVEHLRPQSQWVTVPLHQRGVESSFRSFSTPASPRECHLSPAYSLRAPGQDPGLPRIPGIGASAFTPPHPSPLQSHDAGVKDSAALPAPQSVPAPTPPPTVDVTTERLKGMQELALFSVEEDDEDDEIDTMQRPPWYKQPRVVVFLVLQLLSVAFFVSGLCVQHIVKPLKEVAKGIELYRWFYYFGAWPPLYYATYVANSRLFAVIEWIFYREALYYLEKVERTSRWFLFFLLNMGWYALIFKVLWCQDACEEVSYKKGVDILYKLMLCLMLFALANFIKCVLAKLLSTHFYRTAHFKKVKDALDKEFYLLMLSQPRAKVLKKLYGDMERPLATRSIPQALAHVPSDIYRLLKQDNSEAGQEPSCSCFGKKASRSKEKSHHGPQCELTKQALKASLLSHTPGLSADPLSVVDRTASYISIRSKGGRPRPSSTHLPVQQEVLDALPLQTDRKKTNHKMTAEELAQMRTYLAIKTFTALVRKHSEISDKEEERRVKEARRFAKGLFWNIKQDDKRRAVIRQDFTIFFENQEMADAAFKYFDKDNDKEVTLAEMKDSVVAICKERKNMADSLKDTDSIVSSLEFGIGVVVHFIFAALYLLVWGVDFMKGFSTFSATVLALTFIFGNSVKNVFESMLFLFVEHAYDVGDLLFVDNEYWRVKKIDLMYTVLVKLAGDRIYYPNTQLMQIPIINMSRSANKYDMISFLVDVGCPPEVLKELEAAVKKHVDANPSEFTAGPFVTFGNIEEPFKTRIKIGWTLSFPGEDVRRANLAKSAIVGVVQQRLAQLAVEYTVVYQKIMEGKDKHNNEKH